MCVICSEGAKHANHKQNYSHSTAVRTMRGTQGKPSPPPPTSRAKQEVQAVRAVMDGSVRLSSPSGASDLPYIWRFRTRPLIWNFMPFWNKAPQSLDSSVGSPWFRPGLKITGFQNCRFVLKRSFEGSINFNVL